MLTVADRKTTLRLCFYDRVYLAVKRQAFAAVFSKNARFADTFADDHVDIFGGKRFSRLLSLSTQQSFFAGSIEKIKTVNFRPSPD